MTQQMNEYDTALAAAVAATQQTTTKNRAKCKVHQRCGKIYLSTNQGEIQ